MSVKCRICDTEIDPNRVLKNRFFREMYQDVICKWVNIKTISKKSLCQACMGTVVDFYKFKQLSRGNISKVDASEDGDPAASPDMLQSLLDGCKESVELSAEVLQVLDPNGSHEDQVGRNVPPKRVCQRKTEEEKAMRPEEYKTYYYRKMRSKYEQVCSICGKKIEKKRIEGHINGHLGLEPFPCPHCSMPFNCRVNLASHIRRMHTVQNPCEKCGKIINGNIQLKRHMQEVHSDKAVSCPICKVKFRQRSYLKIHMQNQHSDQRDYVCGVCGKAFARKFVLNVHLRTHTREELYRCEVCTEGFIHRRLYTIHMERHHPGHQPKTMKSDAQWKVKRTLMKKLYSVG
uniref:Putative c2h2-type zn-finger protein n=1 Tax=Culex tarsalis TaxID=7177 RepID=A0A1Q3F3H3_CULTA